MRKQFLLLSGVLIFIVVSGFGQQIPNLISKRDSVYFSQPYPYILPILGEKAHKANVRLPMPFGIMFNTLTGKQSMQLENMYLGFGNHNNPGMPDMIDLDEVVAFDKTAAQTATFNLRIDTWVLPFLNVHGIVGQTKKADINVALIKPFPLEVSTEVSGTYVGFGTMLAGAIGPFFISADFNNTYNYNPRLDEPINVLIGGLRTGPVFRFKNKPQMNVSLWTGATYTYFDSETTGNIDAIDLAPNAPAKIDEMQADLDDWYNELPPLQQNLYKNLYERLGNGLSGLKDGVENGYIRYSFDKTIDIPWTMLLGAQWQINYRWQVRAEAQFLGDRTAGLFSLNYRFGVRGKNWFSR